MSLRERVAKNLLDQTNPVGDYAIQMRENNLGNLAAYELINRRNNLTEEGKRLIGNQNYLFENKYFNDIERPKFDRSAGPLNPEGHFDAINVGYNPSEDKMEIGDSPEIGRITFSKNTGNDIIDNGGMGNVLSHELAHKYQDLHPLWKNKFKEALDESGVNNTELGFFVKTHYPKERYEDEMYAYMFGNKKIPKELKEFYKGIIK